MKPEDKQRITDAFNKAISRQPAEADLPIEGMGKEGGGPITSRELIQNTLSEGKVFDLIDQVVATGQRTVDQFVNDFENMSLPIRMKPPQP